MNSGIDAERGSARRAAVFIVTFGCLVMLGVGLYYLANAMLVEALRKAGEGHTAEAEKNDDRSEETVKLMRALKDNPNDAAALAGLGHLFLHSGDFARAAAFFERAVALVPNDPALLRGLAFARMECDQLAEAEAALRHAMQHDSNAENHYLLAVVYARQLPQKRNAAIEQCDAVLADANVSIMLRNHAQALKETLVKSNIGSQAR